jgi:hypothetical protein
LKFNHFYSPLNFSYSRVKSNKKSPISTIELLF